MLRISFASFPQLITTMLTLICYLISVHKHLVSMSSNYSLDFTIFVLFEKQRTTDAGNLK